MADKFVCQPDGINTRQRFCEAFGNCETENSARWIVRFCQRRGEGWEPFNDSEIDGFYGQHFGIGEFPFNRLTTDGFIVKVKDRYHITPDFVRRCYEASPA